MSFKNNNVGYDIYLNPKHKSLESTKLSKSLAASITDKNAKQLLKLAASKLKIRSQPK